MAIIQLDQRQERLRFDGVNDYVTFTTVDTGTVTSLALIFEMVIIGGFNILSSSAGSRYMFGFTSTMFFINYLGVSGTISYSFLANRTYSAVVTRSGNAHTLYVDGANVGSVNIVTGLSSTYNIIGAEPANLVYSNCIMDGYKVFSSALSQAEVTQLYLKQGVPPNCVLNYEFANKQGFTLTDYVAGNNATLTNYTAGDVTIGATNKWLYEDNTPYTAIPRPSPNLIRINNN